LINATIYNGYVLEITRKMEIWIGNKRWPHT